MGEYKENRLNGVGAYFFSNGEVYQGQLWNDRFHGNGTYYWTNGAKYIGEHRMDQRTGLGLLLLPLHSLHF